MSSTHLTSAPPTQHGSRLAQQVEAARKGADGESPYQIILRRVRERVALYASNLKGRAPQDEDVAYVSHAARTEIGAYINKAALEGLAALEVSPDEAVTRIVNDILFMGPLTPFLSDEHVEEVIITGTQNVWVITGDGLKRRINLPPFSPAELTDLINRLVSAGGRQVNAAFPILDATLPDHSRVNVVIDPIATPSPSVTIRRHRLVARTMQDLLRLGTLSESAAEFLQAAVKARFGLLVCGGTSTGKTNFLNVLAGCFEGDERIVVVEDTHELALPIPDTQYLITRRATAETTPITQRELVANALRMRPDRIVVGEVRGGEALDMILAANTGHEGFMGTIHASSALDGLRRVMQLCELSAEAKAVRQETLAEWVAKAFQLVVFLVYDRQQRRRYVREIYEVSGRVEAGGVIVNQPVFKYDVSEHALKRYPLQMSPESLTRFQTWGIASNVYMYAAPTAAPAGARR